MVEKHDVRSSRKEIERKMKRERQRQEHESKEIKRERERENFWRRAPRRTAGGCGRHEPCGR